MFSVPFFISSGSVNRFPVIGSFKHAGSSLTLCLSYPDTNIYIFVHIVKCVGIFCVLILDIVFKFFYSSVFFVCTTQVSRSMSVFI